MNKQIDNKAIEEMAKIIANKMCYAFIDGRCSLNGSACDLICKQGNEYKEVAEALYNTDYCKVDANAEITVGEKVVLSKTEYNKILESKEPLRGWIYRDGFNDGREVYSELVTQLSDDTKALKQESKEKAKDILQEVNQLCKEQADRFSHICKTKKEAREETCRYEGVLAVKNRLGKIAEKHGIEVE